MFEKTHIRLSKEESCNYNSSFPLKINFFLHFSKLYVWKYITRVCCILKNIKREKNEERMIAKENQITSKKRKKEREKIKI